MLFTHTYDEQDEHNENNYDDQMLSRDSLGQKITDMSDGWGKTMEKNLSQETCTNYDSNQDSLDELPTLIPYSTAVTSILTGR